MPEDKLQKRYEALEKVIEVLSHGKATIEWADKIILTVSEIDAKESKVTK